MKIYVGNLPYKVDDSRLKEMFSAYGEVSDSKVIIDRETKRSKGFGFVEMADQSEGDKAIKELDGKEFEGRNLKVNVAKPETDRPKRSFR